MVSINYRLGLLGFFEAITSGFPRSIIPGNQALRDWITALNWIYVNIGHFGGDRTKITIFGESAGGTAVRALLSTPSAKPLFRAAIIQSDPIDLPFNEPDIASGALGAEYVQLLGCTAGNISCVTSQDLFSLLEYSYKVSTDAVARNPSLSPFEVYKPCIDGELVLDDFYDLVRTGEEDHVPLMIGTLKDEADHFVYIALLFSLCPPSLRFHRAAS